MKVGGGEPQTLEGGGFGVLPRQFFKVEARKRRFQLLWKRIFAWGPRPLKITGVFLVCGGLGSSPETFENCKPVYERNFQHLWRQWVKSGEGGVSAIGMFEGVLGSAPEDFESL